MAAPTDRRSPHHATAGGTETLSTRTRIGVILGAAVVAVVAIVAAQTFLLDPYRSGTRHGAIITVSPCTNHVGSVALDDPRPDELGWQAQPPIPDSWSRGATYRGTLLILGDKEARFDADDGGSVMVRRGFSDLSCSIA